GRVSVIHRLRRGALGNLRPQDRHHPESCHLGGMGKYSCPCFVASEQPRASEYACPCHPPLRNKRRTSANLAHMNSPCPDRNRKIHSGVGGCTHPGHRPKRARGLCPQRGSSAAAKPASVKSANNSPPMNWPSSFLITTSEPSNRSPNSRA